MPLARWALSISAFALATASAPAISQIMNMPGMKMPMPVKKAAPAAKKAVANKPAAKRIPHRKTSAAARKEAVVPPKSASSGQMMPMPSQHSSGSPASIPMDHSMMDHGDMPMPAQPSAEPQPPSPTDHSRMDHGQGQMTMPMGEHGIGHAMAMNGALGPYPMERESSGTAWQPDTSGHTGLHATSGDWTLMAHGTLNVVYDRQSGRRGDDKAFISGMLMSMAQHPLGNGTLQFKAMLSPDPIMGPKGYPLLLASGETANGVDRLIDR